MPTAKRIVSSLGLKDLLIKLNPLLKDEDESEDGEETERDVMSDEEWIKEASDQNGDGGDLIFVWEVGESEEMKMVFPVAYDE